jgi:hypothetical protein
MSNSIVINLVTSFYKPGSTPWYHMPSLNFIFRDFDMTAMHLSALLGHWQELAFIE